MTKAAAQALHSMTGYGRGVASSKYGDFIVEIRTVNGRHLELRPKLLKALLPLEGKIRERLSQSIHRGVVDLHVTLQPTEHALSESIDGVLAAAYSRSLQQIAQQLGLEHGLTAAQLVRLPGVLGEAEFAVQDSPEKLWPSVREALEKALRELLCMRKEEGERLRESLVRELKVAESHLALVQKEREQINDRYLARLKERVGEFANRQKIQVDESRLYQEMIFYVDRSDVAEEIDRLHSHFSQVRTLLHGSEGGAGKRVDFLLQEVSREVNTIGAKANILDITKQVLEMKAAIERLREQAQNLE